MLRKHLPKLIGVVILLFLFSVLLIPDLALRTAVFWRSPVKAFTMEYEEDVEYEKRDGFGEDTKLYRITKNIPHEDATDADLVIWQVSRWGPFYIGDYYGWGLLSLLPRRNAPHEIEAKHHPEIHRHCAPDSPLPDLSDSGLVSACVCVSHLSEKRPHHGVCGGQGGLGFGRRAERQYDDLPYHKEYPSCRGNGP